jgi:subtilase family serine protease
MSTKRRISFARFLLSATCAATLLFLVMRASAQQRQVLHTKIAAVPSEHPISRLPESQRMNIALTLRLRNPEALQNLLQQLYNPASPQYRQFLSVEQFTEQFGPTPDDYQRVIDFATSHGLTIANKTPNRLVLDVSGTVTDIEKTFLLKMQNYQHPTEKRTYFAPDQEPSVEADVPIH